MTSEHVSNETPAGDGAAATHGLPWQHMQRLALISGFVGLALFAVVGLLESATGDRGFSQFFTSYLVGWTYWLALPVGCMGLIGIQFLTGASWGVLLRRPFEAATRTLPLLFVLAIPLAISVFVEKASPYPWTHSPESLSSVPAEQADLQHKFDVWCNAPGYVIRLCIYFAIWGVFIFLYNKYSRRVEESNDMVARRFAENLAGPSIVAFTLINMFAVTDIVMSIELHFASTMFPLIYSINQLLMCLCLSVAVFLTLAEDPDFKRVLRPKFQIDMGSFMLGLTMIWSYMNFSQYMLFWIGNMPEEIPYYLKRRGGGWDIVFLLLAIFHFACPFVLLLFRDVKLHRKRLRAMAIFLLIMCAIDVVWWIEPAYQHDGFPLYLFMDAGALDRHRRHLGLGLPGPTEETSVVADRIPRPIAGGTSCTLSIINKGAACPTPIFGSKHRTCLMACYRFRPKR